MSVFISYSHHDAPFAEQVVSALQRSGVPFSLDRLLLEAGDSLTGRIGKTLDQASAVIALISEQSLKSDWVKRELASVHASGVRVVPVKCEDTPWPAELLLKIGDALYIDARDPLDAIGSLPKTLWYVEQEIHGRLNSWFPLNTRPRAPHCRVFGGSLEAALDELCFGRVFMVVPTDQSVDLCGKVTSAVLDFLGIKASDLNYYSRPISSRQVAPLLKTQYRSLEVHLAGATVFHASGHLRAEDQWRSAEAVLTTAHSLKCSLALVPPMGTGVYGWPASSAVRNWLFGAIRWTVTSVVTEDATWPVICQPGAGAQRRIAEYLSAINASRLRELEQGRLAR